MCSCVDLPLDPDFLSVVTDWRYVFSDFKALLKVSQLDNLERMRRSRVLRC